MTEPAIRFEKLGHAYRADQWVFRGYSGSVFAGKVLGILGPNGRGKSTLLKALLGLITPTAGVVHIKGETAFVPQLFQAGFDYTLLDIVLMGRAKRIGLLSQPAQVDVDASMAALARFALADRAHLPFHELSGGQRQMAILARAITAEADILVLDEPTAALDFKNQIVILDWIQRLSAEDGLAIVFTTHHPEHAANVADQVLLMSSPDAFMCGPAEDVMTEKNLSDLYGVALKELTLEHQGRQLKTFMTLYAPQSARGR
jgi:iron complex transport system ATP-binding protein